MLDSDAARFRLFEAASDFFRRAGVTAPIVLVLDDLHAADSSSLLLLEFLARELRSMRMLVIGLLRDVDPTPAANLARTLMDVAREPLTHNLALRGLREREVLDYVKATSSDIASVDLARALHAKTEGNPLFVGEIVRLLSVEGVPRESRDELAIPRSIKDVITRRLRHLSDECSHMLEIASVFGREFELNRLVAAGQSADADLLDALDEAVAGRIVSNLSSKAERFRFAHVLIRDTVYEAIPAARRAALHRRAGAALESLHGDAALPERAYHAVAGREFATAIELGRRAGDQSLGLLAFEESAQHYRTALESLALAHTDDELTRCSLLLSLGEAEARAGNRAAAQSSFMEAAALAERLALPRELARAAAGYGGRIAWARAADDERLVPLLEAGLAVVGGDVALRVILLARLAGALRDEHSRVRREALSREALELARGLDDPVALAHALEGRSAALVAPDTLAECIELSEELCVVAEQLQDWERLTMGHDACVTLECMVGNIVKAMAHQKAAARVAERLKQPAQRWLVLGTEAALACAAGNLDEAERLADAAFAFGERAQPEMAVPVHRLQRYVLADLRGELEQVEAILTGLVTDYPSRPMLRCVLAHVDARLGRTEEAGKRLEHFAKDDFEALPFDQEWLFAMSLLAEACVRVGDASTASRLYDLTAPWSACNAADLAEGIRGSMARYVGLLAMTCGYRESAVRHFEAALAANELMGATPWLARTQEDFARMLIADPGGDADRIRGRELLEAAMATYRELKIAPQA